MADLVEDLSTALGESYTVERELLGGAMSRVFVAQDRALGRKVAVKVLTREVAAEVKTERFRLEIQLAARLQHPHIVPLLQSGEMHGVLYYTMPFIEGESLRSRLDRDGAMPMSDALRTLRQVASAIAYAHRQGVVHRDIKPDNVLIADEFALVTDFGVAKALSASTQEGGANLTSSGVAIGTPAYMSPEQALADPQIDHRSDIYAFGCLAYEVLTGAPPFKGKSAQATLAAHVVQLPDPIAQIRPEIPSAVAAIVMRCLEKNPSDRPDSAGELLQVFDAASSGSHGSAATPVPPAPIAAPPSRERSRTWALATLGLIVLSAGAYEVARRNQTTPRGTADLSSVAVLPLVNVGGNQTDEYFSDGMTDELSNALSKLPGLKVASRTSAYAFKGQNTDVGEIGRKLKVQTVLEGTVRRQGPRLRVAAQLTNVSDGLALWSDTYERETSDVFSVQDDIAQAIASALKVKLGSQSRTFSSDSRGTRNLAAFDNYLRGRFFLNRRGADGLRLAVAYFDSAIVRDPAFARAHAARAMAYALLPEYTDSTPQNVSALARGAAGQALAIDSSNAEAYTALGLVGVHDWRFAEAEAAYRKALGLDPQYPTAHQWYGELFFHTGRVDSSIAQIRTAIELDPLAPINASALGYALIVDRQFNAAIAELRKGIELTPTLGLHHAMLGDAYLMTRRLDQALAEFEASVRLEPELALRKGYLAHVYGQKGQTEKANAIIAQLEHRQRTRGRAGVALAVAYLGLGDHGRALTALEQAVDEHDISLFSASSLVPDPIWNPLRNEPRFQAILKRMNLAPYAKQTRSR
ncbi:MAG: protein kinase [Gemmatimonadales bacterium]